VKAGAVALLASAILASSGRAMAQCENEVRSIATTLDADARGTRVWYWSWMAAGTALIAGQGTAAAFAQGDLRVELATGAAASVFIPAVLLVHPPLVLSDQPLLDARLEATTVGRMPEGTGRNETVAGTLGDSCVAVQRARELLERDADDEALATGWFAHAFVIGGNIALGLLLGLGFHDWWGAAKQAVGGSAVGELQILTLPARALGARNSGTTGHLVLGPGLLAGTF
jgi:hypothetical protein